MTAADIRFLQGNLDCSRQKMVYWTKITISFVVLHSVAATFINYKSPPESEFKSSFQNTKSNRSIRTTNFHRLRHSRTSKWITKPIHFAPKNLRSFHAMSTSSIEENKSGQANMQSFERDVKESQYAIDEATTEFLKSVEKSLQDENFVSISLHGPKIPKKKNKKNPENISKEKEMLRGSIKLVTGRIIELKNKKSSKRKGQGNQETLHMQATIKFHGATDVAKNWAIDKNLSASRSATGIGLADLISGKFIAQLSKSAGNVDFFDENDNLSHKHGIRKGELVTTSGTYTIQRKKNTASFSYSSKENMANKATTGGVRSKILSHDNIKNVPLSPNAKFLQKLGVSKEDGKPRPGMSSKLRQCQRFVEIVGSLVENHIPVKGNTKLDDNTLLPQTSLKTVDMGCGRGYLTFSLHSFLMQKYRSYGTTIESVGIDIRPKLVREINDIAKDLGDDFRSLRFVEGAIENFLPSNQIGESEINEAPEHTGDNGDESSLDILIALHACDTATDDSLWFGIKKNAKVIVSAPCCHKEVRKQLDPFVTKMKLDHPLHDVLRHGIYRERIAESVTDSIRALLLEIAGYDVQVFEFIGGEHTSKNVMITAVKKGKPSKVKLDLLRDRLHSLASLHGIETQTLGNWMGETMTPRSSKIDMLEGDSNLTEIPPLPISRKLSKPKK